MASGGQSADAGRDVGCEELDELRSELTLVRLELEKARAAEEEAQEKLGRHRRSRMKAERLAETLAKAMSDLQIRQLREQMRGGLLRRVTDRDLPTRREWSQIQLLRQSPYFWPGWYLRNNLDVAEAGTEPALHFLRSGHREGRDPSPNFSIRRYTDSHPEVRRQGLNALLYAIETGATPPVKHKRRKQDT